MVKESMPVLKLNLVARLACAALCAMLGIQGKATALAGPGAATAPVPEPIAELGIMRFSPPAGWQSEEQAGRDARVFVSPDSTADRQAAIVVLITQPLGQSFDFRARFEKAIVSAAGSQPITEHGQVLAGKNEQGCDTLEQTFSYKNSAGQSVRARLVADRVADRLAAFCYLAGGEDFFDKHADALADLLSTVRFEGQQTTAPAAAATSLPLDPQLGAIEREKAELRKRLAELESREQSLSTQPVTATAPGESTTLAHSTSPGQDPPANPGEGSIDVNDQSHAGAGLGAHFPKRTRLVLTLTPVTPPGPQVRTIACDIDRLAKTARFTGFPPGRYRVTAKAVTPDEKSWPLKLTTSAAPTLSDWMDAVEIGPAPTGSIGVTDRPR
jgi:hypothetical protein